MAGPYYAPRRTTHPIRITTARVLPPLPRRSTAPVYRSRPITGLGRTTTDRISRRYYGSVSRRRGRRERRHGNGGRYNGNYNRGGGYGHGSAQRGHR
jgi:hypothetical protein